MIESIRNFFAQCPYLKDGKLNVGYLGAEPVEYAIEFAENGELLKKYFGGGELRELLFSFSSRERIGGSVRERLELANFYENVYEWIKMKNRAGELPELGGNKTAQELYPLGPAAVTDVTDDSAKYMLRCRLVYYEGGANDGE